MKIMKILFTYFAVIVLFQRDVLARDYPYFITEDEHVRILGNGTRAVDSGKIEEAKQSPECRPATLDVGGNWGVPTNGMQASIRFDKALFATNSSILATVIIRNVGEEWRMYEVPFGLASCITVINPERKQLERKDWADAKGSTGQSLRISAGHRPMSVDPGMQRKLSLDLQQFYDFGLPGKYLVNVKLKTFPERSTNFTYVQSVDAVITITNSSAATNNVTPK